MSGPGPGSWVQSGPGNAASSLGKVQTAPGTPSLSDRITVGSTTTAIIAASTALSRTILIYVPSTADTGVHLNFGASATTSEFLAPPGFVGSFDTLQALNGIRGGSTNIVVEVLAFEVSS